MARGRGRLTLGLKPSTDGAGVGGAGSQGLPLILLPTGKVLFCFSVSDVYVCVCVFVLYLELQAGDPKSSSPSDPAIYGTGRLTWRSSPFRLPDTRARDPHTRMRIGKSAHVSRSE